MPSSHTQPQKMSFNTGYNIAYKDMNSTLTNHTDSATENDFPRLAQFYHDFRIPLGAISLVVALIGILFNIMNIIVLLHPKQRNPVNILLTMAAISQVLLLVIYVPYVSIYNLSVSTEKEALRFVSTDIHDTRFLLFYADASVFLHLNNSWLIITTACFRFIFVQFPLRSARFCTYNRAIIAGVCTTIMCLLIQIPNFIVNSIVTFACDRQIFGEVCQASETLSTVSPNGNLPRLEKVNIGIQAAFGRFIPAILLLIFTIFLMRVLSEAYKRKKRLHSDSRAKQGNTGGQKNEHSQTTKMLLAVVMLFFIVEFPHGILLAYITITKEHAIYNYLGEVIDLVTIIAFSLNLLLYSTMSKQYRNLFFEIFCHQILKKLRASKSRRRLPKYSSSPYYSAHNNSHIGSTAETCNLSMTLESHVMSPAEPNEDDSLMKHNNNSMDQVET